MSSPEDHIVEVQSTSRRTAEANPIVLRETGITRLVFHPKLLDNTANPQASIDGHFVFERKGPRDEWEEISAAPLSTLKAGEHVKLDLKAREVKLLFDGLSKYYDLVAEHGIRTGLRRFIPAPRSKALQDLVANERSFRSALNDENLVSSLLRGLISWIAENEAAVAAARFDGISLQDLQQFDAVLALARLQHFCKLLDANAENGDEGFWQKTLDDHGWAIAQVFAIPTMLVTSQVYVGGKKFINRGGNVADFLYENQISGNVVVVEIKTPIVPIVGDLYRNNVYPPSQEMTQGLAQIQYSHKQVSARYEELVTEDMISQRSLHPRGLLIAGWLEGHAHAEIEGFEIWRNSHSDVDIVTFDELRAKVGLMVDLLEKAADI